MMKSFLLIIVTFLYVLGLNIEAQIPAGGAKDGWTYFGTLTNPDSPGAAEWTDLHFSWTVTTVSAAKSLSKDVLLTCTDARTLRSGPVIVTANGTLQWPPIIGFLAANTTVRITDTSQHMTKGGIAYWVNVSVAQ